MGYGLTPFGAIYLLPTTNGACQFDDLINGREIDKGEESALEKLK